MKAMLLASAPPPRCDGERCRDMCMCASNDKGRVTRDAGGEPTKKPTLVVGVQVIKAVATFINIAPANKLYLIG